MSDRDLIAESHQAEVMVMAMSQGKDPALGVSVVKTIQRLADALEARQVDEAAVEKVAQVIYQHSEVTDDGMVCQCGYRSECDLALHQARAVVEFLGERHEPEPKSDPLRVRIQQLIDNQQSWIDAGRSGQAISRDAVRDSLQRVLDETEPEAEPAHRVHNHGPHEGDGLDCSELRGDDGLLRGRCVRGLEHFHVWSEVPCKPGECRMPVAPQPSESDRSAVPDAATERTRQAEAELSDMLRVDIPSLKAERDAALAAVERVRAIHPPVECDRHEGCPPSCEICLDDWPCPTIQALDGAPEQYEHESVAPQPSESDVRERLVEAALETVDWDAIDAGEASPREAAGHAVWKALAALDGAPEPETAPENYEPKCNCEHVKRHTSPPLPVEGERP